MSRQPGEVRHRPQTFCSHAHYAAWLATRRTLAERFWSKVRKTDTCWLWTGARMVSGYGYLHSRGQPMVYAHRLAWTLHHGDIPDGLVVCHHCDTPPCVRPDHLFLGTQADNIADARSKVRPPGRPKKVSDADVPAIRTAYATGQVSQRELAREYGVAQTTISSIVRRAHRRSL